MPACPGQRAPVANDAIVRVVDMRGVDQVFNQEIVAVRQVPHVALAAVQRPADVSENGRLCVRVQLWDLRTAAQQLIDAYDVPLLRAVLLLLPRSVLLCRACGTGAWEAFEIAVQCGRGQSMRMLLQAARQHAHQDGRRARSLFGCSRS